MWLTFWEHREAVEPFLQAQTLGRTQRLPYRQTRWQWAGRPRKGPGVSHFLFIYLYIITFIKVRLKQSFVHQSILELNQALNPRSNASWWALNVVVCCCNVMMNVCIFILFLGPCLDVLFSILMSFLVWFVIRAARMQDKFQTCKYYRIVSYWPHLHN